MGRWNKNDLKVYLDEKAEQYEHAGFLETDPLGILHELDQPTDQEILGLLVATIAWGNRASIIKSGLELLKRLDHQPHNFIVNATEMELKQMSKGFVHRTFNENDLLFFLTSLKRAYAQTSSLESFFISSEPRLDNGIIDLRSFLLMTPHEVRTRKHLADPEKSSASKRLHLYLRWMVRSANKGVDLGIWKQVKASQLSCPLDVHSGRIARSLGLLTRKQNDLRAVIELDSKLRAFDSNDPVKYDFALFGIGAFEFVDL
jgi:uncharacterized protein (TIGR02757 family)